MEIWPGQAYPLGATFDRSGTNFALFSEVADRVELCLFDADGRRRGVELTEVDATCGTAAAVGAARAALRLPRTARGPARAPLQPQQAAAGPYAKAIGRRDRLGPGAVRLPSDNFGDGLAQRRRLRDRMTHGVVINPFFDWEGRPPAQLPYNESVIYEAHVKGLTERHPRGPEEQRGTYAGLAHPRSSSTSPSSGSRPWS